MSTHPAVSAAAPVFPHDARSRLGDQVLGLAIAMAAAVALFLGASRGQFGLAALVTAALLGVSLLGWGLLAPTLRRHAYTVTLVGLVALHIQLAGGQLEYHFGVFVVLAFMLVYMDVSVILLAAVLFAVHHVLFDRLQAAGYGFFCTTQADFGRVMLHAAYVVVQAGVELMLAARLGRAAQEGEELAAIVARVDAGGRLNLALGAPSLRSRGAQALAAMMRPHGHGRVDRAAGRGRRADGQHRHRGRQPGPEPAHGADRRPPAAHA